LYLEKGGGMAKETAERYYIVPYKKGEVWQGKQQKGIILYLKKGGGMARETAERYYFVP
jgi:hypothetical protein